MIYMHRVSTRNNSEFASHNLLVISPLTTLTVVSNISCRTKDKISKSFSCVLSHVTKDGLLKFPNPVVTDPSTAIAVERSKWVTKTAYIPQVLTRRQRNFMDNKNARSE